MCDDHQGPGPAVQEVLHHVEGLDVEVVGRLVQEQHVGLGEKNAQQLEAPAFTAGEVAEAGRESVTGEPEPLQQGRRRDLPVHGLRDSADRLDRVQDPSLRIQIIELLGQVLERHRPTMLHAAGVRRQRAREQLQQGGLASTVDSDDPDPVACAQPPRRTREQHLLPPREIDVLDVDDVLAEALGGEPLQFEAIPRRGYVGDQGVRGLHPELRLGRARWCSPPEPGEFLAHQVLATSLAGSRLPHPLRLGEHEGGVPTLIEVDDGVVNLPGPLAHLVEEPSIVGHHHHRGRSGHQVGCQPGDRFHVEVVGRLVQDDQVMLA